MSQSSVESFSQKSSTISNIGQKKLFASTTGGRKPVPKSTLQYIMISEPPHKKKGPTYANSPILRRLASPYGEDFAASLAAASETDSGKTPKKKFLKKTKKKKTAKKSKKKSEGEHKTKHITFIHSSAFLTPNSNYPNTFQDYHLET